MRAKIQVGASQAESERKEFQAEGRATQRLRGEVTRVGAREEKVTLEGGGFSGPGLPRPPTGGLGTALG